MTTSNSGDTNILRFDRPNSISSSVIGETRANIVASELICGAVPFHCQPMQDDSYVFTVADSSGEFLHAVTAMASTTT